jgi:hypothetical protein
MLGPPGILGNPGPPCRYRDAICHRDVACRHSNACKSAESCLDRGRRLRWSFKCRRMQTMWRAGEWLPTETRRGLFSTKWNLACIQKVNRSPFMATTGVEINPEPVAIEWERFRSLVPWQTRLATCWRGVSKLVSSCGVRTPNGSQRACWRGSLLLKDQSSRALYCCIS